MGPVCGEESNRVLSCAAIVTTTVCDSVSNSEHMHLNLQLSSKIVQVLIALCNWHALGCNPAVRSLTLHRFLICARNAHVDSHQLQSKTLWFLLEALC